jgi:hypothetical protein
MNVYAISGSACPHIYRRTIRGRTRTVHACAETVMNVLSSVPVDLSQIFHLCTGNFMTSVPDEPDGENTFFP